MASLSAHLNPCLSSLTVSNSKNSVCSPLLQQKDFLAKQGMPNSNGQPCWATRPAEATSFASTWSRGRCLNGPAEHNGCQARATACEVSGEEVPRRCWYSAREDKGENDDHLQRKEKQRVKRWGEDYAEQDRVHGAEHQPVGQLRWEGEQERDERLAADAWLLLQVHLRVETGDV
mmetsp:Transcript_33688/g.78329  ORF Transcript_33688/g.78329 Transcript_33688/m.78329 type:complete len:175 (-) Transcript_33688:1024-1548(-)